MFFSILYSNTKLSILCGTLFFSLYVKDVSEELMFFAF